MELQPFTAERVWTAEEIPILTARLTLPEPAETESRAARRIRRYYHLQQRAFLRYCEVFLLPQAEAEYRAALAVSAPLPHFQAELSFTVTYQEGTLLSLYTQVRETTLPGRRSLTRWGDTWDLATGYPLPLTAFFPPRSGWRKTLLTQIETQLRQQEAQGIARYHERAPSLLRRHFNSRNYYLTPEGIAIFYPMHSIAPPVEGIPAFTVPFEACEACPGAKEDRRW